MIEEIKKSSEPDFNFYKTLTVNTSPFIDSNDLEYFPVLFSFFDKDLRDRAQSDGDDIAFFIEDNQLDHEIELYDPDYNETHSKLMAWVKIPKVLANDSLNIAMRFGGSLLDSQQNSKAVWDDNFVGAWHFAPNSLQIANDSTQYNNDGIIHYKTDASIATNLAVNEIVTLDYDISGSVLDFAHQVDSILIEDDTSLNMQDDITISFWIKLKAIVNENVYILAKGTDKKRAYSVFLNSSGYLVFFLNDEESNTKGSLSSARPLSTGSWVHVTCIRDFETIKILLNGQVVASEVYDKKIKVVPGPLTIGSSNLYGYLTELRISNTARSEDWILLDTINQGTSQLLESISSCQSQSFTSSDDNDDDNDDEDDDELPNIPSINSVPTIDIFPIVLIALLSISTISFGITTGYLKMRSGTKKNPQIKKKNIHKYARVGMEKIVKSEPYLGSKTSNIPLLSPKSSYELVEKPLEGPSRIIQVSCPVCRATKNVTLPNNLITETSTITTISVPRKFICQHHFVFFLDRYFEIRGYESIDYQIRTYKKINEPYNY